MAKEFSRWFYDSKAWRKCRDSFFIYKAGICDRCEGVGLVVHHKIWLTPMNINEPNITLSWDNLELLCQTCHNQEHLKSPATDKACMFDEIGNLISK